MVGMVCCIVGCLFENYCDCSGKWCWFCFFKLDVLYWWFGGCVCDKIKDSWCLISVIGVLRFFCLDGGLLVFYGD